MFDQIFKFLTLVNEYARVGKEDEMHQSIEKLDQLLGKVGMKTIRDETHLCYTIGLTEYTQEN